MVSKMAIAMIILGVVGTISIVAGVATVFMTWREPVEQERAVDIAQDISLAGMDGVTVVSRHPVIVRGTSGAPTARLRGTQRAIAEVPMPRIVQRETAQGLEIEVVEGSLRGLFDENIRAWDEEMILEVSLPERYGGHVRMEQAREARVEGIEADRVSVRASGDIVLEGVSAGALDVRSDWGDTRLSRVRAQSAGIVGPLERIAISDSRIEDLLISSGAHRVRATLSEEGTTFEYALGDDISFSLASLGEPGDAALSTREPLAREQQERRY